MPDRAWRSPAAPAAAAYQSAVYQPATFAPVNTPSNPNRPSAGPGTNCVSWNLFTGCQTSEGTQGMPQDGNGLGHAGE